MDVDGVMTDGVITFDHWGRETKRFNVHDGLGIFLARKMGMVVGIITSRSSRAVKVRARELNIEFLSMGHKNKLRPYRDFKRKLNLSDEKIAYVGDDLLDLPVMKKCGFAVCVNDGKDDVKEHAHFITSADGGKGAVREVIELILKRQGKWDSFLEKYFTGFDENE